mgnify:FL=1
MVYDIFMDTSCVKIKILPKNNTTIATTNYIVANPVSLTPKMQKVHLESQYQKFKKGNKNENY